MSPVKPPALRPGSRIGVIAPAGSVDSDRLSVGIAAIRARGYEPELATGVLARKGYLAGSGADRAKDLAEFFRRDDIDAIFCARGGFGSVQLLSFLPSNLRHRAKIFVGYSDVTLLINWFLQRYNLVTFHGPMVAMDLARDPASQSGEFFWDILSGARANWQLPLVRPIRPGKARGRLVGGCLSLLVTTLGTPFEIDTRGRILFLEDVGEKPYRLERMLFHLKLAGKLDGLAGVLLGDFTHCDGDGSRELPDIVEELFAGAAYPVVTGMPAGHGSENITLPLGVEMELDGDAVTIAMLESPVEFHIK